MSESDFVKEELCMKLPDIRDVMLEYKGMLLLYRSALKQMSTKLEILGDEYQFSHGYNPIKQIKSRIKTEESIIRKLQRKRKDITVDNINLYIEDIAGIRILCEFTPDVYRIVDLITSQKDVEVLKTKDYFQDPKPNGYKSYHLLVTIPVCLAERTVLTKIEIQIQTATMNFWSCLEEQAYYKYNGQVPEYIHKDLRECSKMISYLDSKLFQIKEEVKK